MRLAALVLLLAAMALAEGQAPIPPVAKPPTPPPAAATGNEACNGPSCPSYCQYTSFSPPICSTSCGLGQIVSRSFGINVSPNHFLRGAVCPVQVNGTLECEGACVGVPCAYSAWTAAGPCSVSCGKGVRKFTRSPLGIVPTNTLCTDTIRYKECAMPECPVDCRVSAWKKGACNATCGEGVQSMYRTIIDQPKNGGAECPALNITVPCSLPHCDSDCKVSRWTRWSRCNAQCGVGWQTRTRKVVTAQMNNGRACPTLIQHRICKRKACAAGCKYGKWSAWSKCNKACEGGIQIRRRTVVAPLTGTANCAAAIQRRRCNVQPCKINCKMSRPKKFSVPADWAFKCGVGLRFIERKVLRPAAFGGRPCKTRATVVKKIRKAPCPGQCKKEEWGQWGPCSKTCGGGIQRRFRGKGRGKCFNPQPDSEIRTCNTFPCTLQAGACVVSTWSPWSACSQCGSFNATKTRTRSIVVAPASQDPSMQCPPLTEVRSCYRSCKPQACAIASGWSKWSKCLRGRKCGEGYRIRRRKVIRKTAKAVCPRSVQRRGCSTPCKKCDIGEWSAWSPCTAPCGLGIRIRTRSVAKVSGYKKPFKCPAKTQYRRCMVRQCPSINATASVPIITAATKTVPLVSAIQPASISSTVSASLSAAFRNRVSQLIAKINRNNLLKIRKMAKRLNAFRRANIKLRAAALKVLAKLKTNRNNKALRSRYIAMRRKLLQRRLHYKKLFLKWIRLSRRTGGNVRRLRVFSGRKLLNRFQPTINRAPVRKIFTRTPLTVKGGIITVRIPGPPIPSMTAPRVIKRAPKYVILPNKAIRGPNAAPSPLPSPTAKLSDAGAMNVLNSAAMKQFGGSVSAPSSSLAPMAAPTRKSFSVVDLAKNKLAPEPKTIALNDTVHLVDGCTYDVTQWSRCRLDCSKRDFTSGKQWRSKYVQAGQVNSCKVHVREERACQLHDNQIRAAKYAANPYLPHEVGCRKAECKLTKPLTVPRRCLANSDPSKQCSLTAFVELNTELVEGYSHCGADDDLAGSDAHEQSGAAPSDAGSPKQQTPSPSAASGHRRLVPAVVDTQ